MANCIRKGCTGTMRRMWPQRGVIDATPFVCSECGRETHNAVCVDDEGHIECICGLAEVDARRAGVEP